MKKHELALIMLLTLAVFPLNAHAVIEPTDGPYINVDNDPTIPTGDKTEFEWNETPISFVQFSSDDLETTKRGERNLTISWKWLWGADVVGTESVFYDDPGSGSINTWRGLTDWDTLKVGKTGEWTVITSWNNSGLSGGTDGGKAFTLVPEPVSSALFLIGGTCLAAWQLRRKKRSA